MPLLALVVLLVVVPGVHAEDVVRPTSRVTTRLVVREEPSTRSPRLGALAPGETALLLDETTARWYRVRLPDGTEGYVSKAWARLERDTAPTAVHAARRAPTAVAAPRVPPGALELHFIDVGQGDSTLILCPDGRTILVDCGQLPHVSGDGIREYLLQQLARVGGTVDVLVVTHPDQDHYNLLREVLRRVPIGRIMHVGEDGDYNENFTEWLGFFPSAKLQYVSGGDIDQPSSPNASLPCGEAEVFVLAANVQASESPSNARSIVLMVRYGDFEAVLTGDATHDTERAILAAYPSTWLDVDLLKIGHHGSLATSTGEDWAATLRPEYAVVSAGERSQHGHPRGEILTRLEPFTVQATEHAMSSATGKKGQYKWRDVENYREAIYSTAVSGTVVVRSNGTGFVLSEVGDLE